MKAIKILLLFLLTGGGVYAQNLGKVNATSVYYKDNFQLKTKKITAITDHMAGDSLSTGKMLTTAGVYEYVNAADTIRLDPSTLRGPGSAANPLAVRLKSILVTTSTYTVADSISVVLVNYAGGTSTITLPTGASYIDKEITIKNLHASNTVSVGTIAAGDVNSLVGKSSLVVHSNDGTVWNVVMSTTIAAISGMQADLGFKRAIDFGAVRNGTTDDAAALQAWLNGGNRLFLDSGDYKITTPIYTNTTRSNIEIVCHPKARIVLSTTFPFNTIYQAAVAFFNVTGLKISGLSIVGQGMNTSPSTWKNNIHNNGLVGLNIEQCHDVTVEDFKAKDVIKCGIRAYNDTNIILRYIKIDTSYGFGIETRDCKFVNIEYFWHVGIAKKLAPDGDLGLAGLALLMTKGSNATATHVWIDNIGNSNKAEGVNDVIWQDFHVKNSGKDAIKFQPFGTVYCNRALLSDFSVQWNNDMQSDGSAMVQMNDVQDLAITNGILKGGKRSTGIENAIYVYSTDTTLFRSRRIVISNIVADSTGTHIINLSGLSDVSVNNIRGSNWGLVQTPAHAIFISGSNNFNINHCEFWNTTFNNTPADQCGVFMQSCYDFAITDNIFRNIRNIGIGGSYLSSRRISLARNSFYKVGAQCVNPFGEAGVTRNVGEYDLSGCNFQDGNWNTSNAMLVFGVNSAISHVSINGCHFDKGGGLAASGWITLGTGTIARLDIAGVSSIGGIIQPTYFVVPTLISEGDHTFIGSGSPETIVTGVVGDIYRQLDGANGACIWQKTNGTGNTGWSSSLGFSSHVIADADYTITSTDLLFPDTYITFSSQTATRTITIPAASAANAGKKIHFKAGASNNITLSPAVTYAGATFTTITPAGEVSAYSTGSVWQAYKKNF